MTEPEISESRPQTAEDYNITARFYDLMYTEEVTGGDIHFYVDLAAELGDPVLELGCGTGRVTLPLARAGHRVVALDISAAMLSQLQEKLAREAAAVRPRIETRLGDMADFDFDEKFSLIISPFRSFQHLLSPQAQRRCLELVGQHLKPGGRYVHSVFNPNPRFFAEVQRLGPVWELNLERTIPDNDHVVRRYALQRDNAYAQTREILWRFEEYDHTGKLLSTGVERMHLRWQYRWEAEYLLELAGLQIESAYGGFAKEPLVDGSPELIYVCKRAEQ